MSAAGVVERRITALPLDRVRQLIPPAVLVLAALVVGGALAVPRFLTVGNLTNVASQDGILTIAAIGQSLAIITGGIDLSAGGLVGLVSVVTILLAGHGSLVSIVAGVCAGLLVGLVNGLASALSVPPFLVTLATLTVAEGVAQLIAGGAPIAGPPDLPLASLADGLVGGIPVPALVAVGCAGLVYVLARRTGIGRSFFLVGVSRRASRLAGISVSATLFTGYLLAAGFVTLAGLMLTGQVDSGQPGLDPNLAFDAIAACAIGGLPLAGGSGRMLEVVVGAAIYSAADNMVILLNLSAYWQLILTGVIIIVAVLAQGLTPARLARLLLGRHHD